MSYNVEMRKFYFGLGVILASVLFEFFLQSFLTNFELYLANLVFVVLLGWRILSKKPYSTFVGYGGLSEQSARRYTLVSIPVVLFVLADANGLLPEALFEHWRGPTVRSMIWILAAWCPVMAVVAHIKFRAIRISIGEIA